MKSLIRRAASRRDGFLVHIGSYGRLLLVAVLAVTCVVTVGTLEPASAAPLQPRVLAAELPMKDCNYGIIPSSGDMVHSETYGSSTTVTLTNTGLALNPELIFAVTGAITIGRNVFHFTLFPGQSQTYILNPSLITEQPSRQGFAVTVLHDSQLVSWKIRSNICPTDEYMWYSSVGVDQNLVSTGVEPTQGSRQAAVLLRMGRPVRNPVSVAYSTLPGTATAGSDYTPVTGRVVFDPGERDKWAYVPILADSRAEGTETFTLRWNANSSPTNPNTTYVVNPIKDVVVEIFDRPPVAPPPNTPPTASFTHTRRAGAGPRRPPQGRLNP